MTDRLILNPPDLPVAAGLAEIEARTGNVVVTTSVGIGSIDTPGNQREGINVSDAFRRVEDPDGPTLTIDVRLRTGEVRVIEP